MPNLIFILFLLLRNLFKVLLSIALTLIFLSHSLALASSTKVLDLETHISSTSIGQYLDIYIDPDEVDSIDDILRLNQKAWTRLNDEVPNLGHSNNIIWLRLILQNQSLSMKHRLLSLELPTMDDYQIFVAKAGLNIKHFKFGDHLPYYPRLISNRNFVIPIDLESKQITTIYLRLKTHESMQVPLYLMDKQSFYNNEHNSMLIHGLYFGVVLIMMLYNLLLFFSIKDKNYLFFAFYIFSSLLYQLARSGLGFQHIWPSSPSVNNYIFIIAIPMMTVSLSIFMLSFLQIDKSKKIINFILHSMILLSLTLPAISLFSLSLSTIAINLIAFLTITAGMLITIRRYYDGLNYTKFFMFGFVVLLASLLLLVLNKMSILPRNTLTENSSQIADVIAILLMSLSLAQRIKEDHEKRVIAEREVLKNERIVQTEKERYLKLEIATKEEEIQTKEKVFVARAESKAKSDFLAAMSHEIRTPMNGVLGIAEVLATTDLNPQQKYYVNVIEESGNSLLNIINDILDYSKIEAGKIELEQIDFDLNQLCQECISGFTIFAKNKHIELTASIQPDTPIYLKSDPSRLKQIILNLLSNAFKFTSSGSVSLRISSIKEVDNNKHDLCLKFEVKDTGIGISKDQIPKLFSHFSQADSSTTRKYGGTGLGLTICKQLTELLRGEIGIISEKNVGSTFWFTAKVSLASKNFIKHNFIPTISLKNKKILFVDDSPAFIETAKEIATAWGMDVETAFSAEEGLDKLHKAHNNKTLFDIISLDNSMPGKSGLECAEIINNNPDYAKSKILLLSSMEILPDKSALTKIGIDKAIQKPASASFLLETLLTLLGKGGFVNQQAKKQSQNYEQYLEKLSGKKILVAEDNPTNQIVIKKMLENLGLSSEILTDGEQIYTYVKENHSKLDFILMDCEMPVMDGYQTTQMIRTWEKNQQLDPLPIIALTAHALKEYRDKALNSGMNSYITKPINMKTLGKTLVENIQT